MLQFVIFAIFLTIGTSVFEPETHQNWKLLPHDICGQVNSVRITGGEEAPMHAYPWLAVIGYGSLYSSKVSFFCGGVLATSRTILTAAHCVVNLPIGINIKVIRLGEHDVRTDPDCDGNNICSDPVIDVLPSQILIMKSFNYRTLKDDIALVRLQEEIKFSAFIKPICFGGSEFFQKNFVGSMAEVAGWGIYDIVAAKYSPKLQYVKLRVVSNKKCNNKYPKSITITPTQICAGGEVGKDSCKGDSGGPLMKVDDSPYGPRYYLLGIVSFGSKNCGDRQRPGVYTKMSEYMEWFLDNLE